jgi:hypothetical protein
MAIFAITQQQFHLKKRAEELAKLCIGLDITPVKGIRAATQAVNQSCALLNIMTASRGGMLRSFLPFTKEFNLRCQCSHNMNKLKRLLNEAEFNIKKAQHPLLASSIYNTRLKKSYSDEGVYSSPISQPWHRKKTSSDDNYYKMRFPYDKETPIRHINYRRQPNI